MKEVWYRAMMEIVFEAHKDKETRVSEEMEINNLYLQMMAKLRQTRTFTEMDLQQLQDLIDAYILRQVFGQKWNLLWPILMLLGIFP